MVKKWNYIILLSIIFIFVLSTKCFAKISSSDVSVESGGTVTISVRSQEPVSSGAIEFTADSELKLISVSGTRNGKLVAFSSATNISGAILTFQFQVPEVSAKKTYNITFTSKDMADETGKNVNSSSSRTTITVNPKEEITTPPEDNTPPPATTTPTPSTQTKPSTNTTTNGNTPKKEVVTVKEEQEEATPQFGLNSLILKGVKDIQNEQGETIEEAVEIEYLPVFNINTYEYTCTVPYETKRIEVIQDSGIYNENVQINNLNELQVGENIITIKMSKEGEQELTYTIKVIKEDAPVEEVVAEVTEEKAEENQNEEIIISMPLIPFILMQLGIIIAEVIIIKIIPWNKIFKKKDKVAIKHYKE